MKKVMEVSRHPEHHDRANVTLQDWNDFRAYTTYSARFQTVGALLCFSGVLFGQAGKAESYPRNITSSHIRLGRMAARLIARPINLAQNDQLSGRPIGDYEEKVRAGEYLKEILSYFGATYADGITALDTAWEAAHASENELTPPDSGVEPTSPTPLWMHRPGA